MANQEKMQRAIAALNDIAAVALGTPHRKPSPRQESYPATASCGHRVTVYPKALVRRTSKGPCPKCRAVMSREIHAIMTPLDAALNESLRGVGPK